MLIKVNYDSEGTVMNEPDKKTPLILTEFKIPGLEI